MSGLRVFLDPGHRTRPDSYGCRHNGIVEATRVLEIARYLDSYMRCGPLVDTRLSRGDEVKSYERRAIEAKSWRAELVVCLHIDAHEDDAQRGLITYWPDMDNVSGDVARVMARCAPVGLYRDRNAAFAARPGHWTERAHNVMRPYHLAGLRVVLVELGRATNHEDAAILRGSVALPALAAMLQAGAARMHELLTTGVAA